MGSWLSSSESPALDIDLSSKVVVITGGNSGIGYETAKALATMGTKTIIACRSVERASVAVAQIKEEIGRQFPNKSIDLEWMMLDLGSFRSTKDFTVAFKEKNLPLHVLINNAAVSCVPYALTEDGHETQFQVNYLSHLLLTLELLPIIADTASKTEDGRIVFLSSVAHTYAQFDPQNLEGQEVYQRMQFYCNSKLYCAMTAYALQRRVQNEGITVSSLQPGYISTNLTDKGFQDSCWKSVVWKIFYFLLLPIRKSPKDGAICSINCAVNPELNSQEALYYGSDCKPVLSSEVSRDERQQEQLWEISINKIKEFLTPELLQRYGSQLPVNQLEESKKVL